MPDPITWYFDPISPFAYFALGDVEEIARSHAVRYRPIVFGAVLAHWGQLGPAEIEPKRIHTYRLCQFMADQAGIPFRFPPRHPFRSMEALRLIAAADGSPAATRAVMEFVWRDGRDPSDPAELAVLAGALGLDPAVSQEAKERLRGWTEEAIAAGVFGVPTLAIGKELFWGADAMPMARAYMADPGVLATAEMSRLAALPAGVTRVKT